jgi:small subunit ribosomal protein S16
MLKIRLQRHGRKQYPMYHIVAADSRAPRDGKFIDLIGRYNPNTNPATIELNVDKAVELLNNGAQPTETARAILSYKGAMYKHHLLGGVKKGALTLEQAEAKFAAWVEEKDAKVVSKREKLGDSAEQKAKAAMAAEAKVRDERAKALEAKRNPVVAEAEAVAETAEEVVAAPETEAAVETPEAIAPEATAETTETPAAE